MSRAAKAWVATGLLALAVLVSSACGAPAPTQTEVQATVDAVVRATVSAQPSPTATVLPPTPVPAATAVPTTVPVLSDAELAARGRAWVTHIERGHSIGSGVVVSPDGYLLTNQHVVNDTGNILVRLADTRTLFADLIAADADVDLAVLHVPADGLNAANFGDPSRLQQGDPLVVIGFALDLPGEPSIARGIFSGRRSFDGSVSYIQTDAAMNPGMSGGAMLDRTGGLVGINVARIERAGGRAIQGISFAIPSDLARSFVESARAGRPVAAAPSRGTDTTASPPGSLVVNKRYGAALRAAPSSDATVLASMGCGEMLQAISDQDSGGWFHARFGTVDGWVGGARVKPGTTVDAGVCNGAPYPPYTLGQIVRAQVETGCLSVRPSPSASAAVAGCVPSGHLFQLTNGPMEVDGEDWYAVRSTSTGLTGWTRAAYLVR